MGNITFIIGNGLGMALDSKYFSLESGMKSASEAASPETKTFIKQLIGHDTPTTEEQLEEIQNNIFILNKIKALSEELDGSTFNNLKSTIKNHPIFNNIGDYQKYLFDVAAHFCNYEIVKNSEGEKKLTTFIENFANYIRDINNPSNEGSSSYKKCSIATLNYDKLLYEGFLTTKILQNYSGALVDGFWVKKDGFKSTNLDPYYGKRFGWYLHLHGSPLFFTGTDGLIYKDTLKDKKLIDVTLDEEQRNHIILCHPNQKRRQISYSPLLNTYFEYFRKAIEDSSTIVLFGYSGNDPHVNEVIKRKVRAKQEFDLYVIAYQSENSKSEESWKTEFGISKCNLITEDCILDFDFDFERTLNHDRGNNK